MARYGRKGYTGRRKNNRKNNRRYRRNGKRYSKVTKNTVRSPGFPDKVFVKLKYVNSVAVTSGSYYNYLFTGNSVYAPDYTGGVSGHQPMYFDQYAAIYNRYRVHAVKQIMQVSNASDTASLNVTTVHSTSTTAFTSTAKILEQTDARVTRNVPVKQQQAVTMKYFVKTTKAFGITKKEITADNYSPYTNNNPTLPFYIHNHFDAVDGIGGVAFNVLFRLTYYVEFFDKKDIAQS